MPNRLAEENSRYLRQHAHNPIDWYPWGEEALGRARREDRPIFLSVGYASCHWCHVMAREVFEKEDVGRLMNESFVSIKVDREERPDVDAHYMEAVTALTGGGGWPMSVFLTPDLEPFHAGTYYPHDTFLELARAVDRTYRDKRSQIVDRARMLDELISKPLEPSGGGPVDEQWFDHLVEALLDVHDERWGGLAGRMKFPTALVWTFLLHAFRRTGDERTGAAVRRTLDLMASGGLRDHLAGGFHRYTVESRWIIPHFEKMLYDNALLAALYTEAARVFTDRGYEEVARSTLDFTIEVMGDEERGGFFSSLDADSDGEEGAYYVWTPDQVADVAGDEGPALAMLLGVTASGNFQGRSVPNRRADPAQVAEAHGMDVERAASLLSRWRPALLEARRRRTPPALDEKIITSWNGLAIVAMARGCAAFEEERYGRMAERTARRLWREHRREDGTILRASTRGEASGEGMLSDHASFAWGLTELYSATGDTRHLERALALVDDAMERFARPGAGFFETTGRDGLPEKVRTSDNVRPSGVSALLHALLHLSAVTGRPNLRRALTSTLEGFSSQMRRSGADMAFWWDAALLDAAPFLTTVVAGNPGDEATTALVSAFRDIAPCHAVLVTVDGSGPPAEHAALLETARDKRAVEGGAMAYVCRHGSCQSPTGDPEVMRSQILAGFHR
jgi:hypothetical protein